jgi:hypothetical protein
LKIKELQAVVAPFFGHFQKTGHEKDTLFQNKSYLFSMDFCISPAKKDTLFIKNQKKVAPERATFTQI